MAFSVVSTCKIHLCSKWLVRLLVLAVMWGGEGRAIQSKIKATVVDRLGNKHEVSKFTYQDRVELEYYVGDVRRIKPFARIDRIVFEGNRGDEQQAISVYLRNGVTESGSILTGGNSAPRAQDSFGSGRAEILFSGVSELGPFIMRLNEVREVIIRHPAGSLPIPDAPLKATLITMKGKRFEVSQLRFLGKTRFDFTQGRMRRSLPMSKIEKIDFIDSGGAEEQRPVTIVLRKGKTLQGTVGISTVRLPGETDRNYYARLNEVFTGDSKVGSFAIGLRDVKHIRFRRDAEDSESNGAEKHNQEGDNQRDAEMEKAN